MAVHLVSVYLCVSVRDASNNMIARNVQWGWWIMG